MLFYVLLAVLLVVSVIHVLYNCNEQMKLVRKIPKPRELFFIGNAWEIFVTPVELFRLLREYAKSFNGIYTVWTTGIGTVNIYNPDDIETVIASTKHNVKSMMYGFLKSWLREGLLLSSGSKWHQRRKILTPTFHFNILRQFNAILEENSERLVETLSKTKEESLNIVPVISEYTLNSICETAMGTKLHEASSSAGKSYKDAIHKLGKVMVSRVSNVLLISDITFNLTLIGLRAKDYINTVHSFTKRVIMERKEFLETKGVENVQNVADDDVYVYSKKKKIAMLDLLISAEKSGEIDRIGVQEEVDTFMFEGHDTTASGLTYLLMLLANNKLIQDKIVAELEDIFGNSTRTATMEDLAMMRYLDCCIKESMRLYPPVPFIARVLTEDAVLSNYTVPAGTQIHIHIYDLHRREDLFKNAHVFDPDRFLPENCVGRHPYAYIPFSAGPRNCIGQKFAMMEMKSCVAAVLRKFELQPITKPADIEFMSDIVLRNTEPVCVKFVRK